MVDRGGRIRVERVGREASSILIVDDLLSEAEPLVAAGRKVRYGAPQQPMFPGVRAAAPRAYTDILRRAVAPLLRNAFGLQGCEVVSAVSDFSLVTTPPEALAPRQRVPHTDGADAGLIALMHYLTPEGCAGTSFYRHRSTGFERVTPERRATYEAALADEMRIMPQAGYTCGDSELFVRVGGVEGGFNRLVAYRGDLLHSGDIAQDFAFENDPGRGRLTVNSFFVFRPSKTQPAASAAAS